MESAKTEISEEELSETLRMYENYKKVITDYVPLSHFILKNNL